MGLVLFPGTLSNNCSVLSGSNLQHTNAMSSPLSAVVLMSQIIMYTVHLNVPLHMYIENKVTGFTYIALHIGVGTGGAPGACAPPSFINCYIIIIIIIIIALQHSMT